MPARSIARRVVPRRPTPHRLIPHRLIPHRLLPRCLALCAALAAAPAAAQTPVFTPRPCEPALEGARCGTVEVPENRDAPGRMLALNVVVFPARTAAPAREALASFVGGPGQAATESAEGLAARFAALRDDRDLLFVDQRGTGRSAPLQCPLRDPADPQTYLGDYLPPGPVARCLDDLSRTADLARYGYLELAHDVEAVRTALGYDRMDLWGASYGTRAAQVYMRAYPRSVRSAVLEGVVPAGYAQPAAYARNTDAALAGLVRDCRADAACGAAFPDVVGQARAVADRLARSPGTAEIVDPETGARLRLTVTAATFADLLRRMLYVPDAAAQIPYVVHRAHRGDYGPAGSLALQDRRSYARWLYWGLNLAITCTEDVPFVDAAAEARDNGRTLLGDWRTRQQAAACAGWPRYPLPADYHQPIPSDVPTLLVSGELDPVTPPSGGEAAAAYLRNAVHVVVPSAGHTYQGMPGAACVDSLVIRFYRQGSARGLDAACVRDVRRPPFVVTVAEPIALQQAALQRFAGSYAAAGPPPVRLRAEALDGVLRVTFDDGFTVIASPIAPTVFRLEGLPPHFVLRFGEDGRSVLIPTGEGDERVTLTRTP